jgi:hypothetical protein
MLISNGIESAALSSLAVVARPFLLRGRGNLVPGYACPDELSGPVLMNFQGNTKPKVKNPDPKPGLPRRKIHPPRKDGLNIIYFTVS